MKVTNISKTTQTLHTEHGPLSVQPGDAVALDLSQADLDDIRKQPGHFHAEAVKPPAEKAPAAPAAPASKRHKRG
jgi:hypothetical protein